MFHLSAKQLIFGAYFVTVGVLEILQFAIGASGLFLICFSLVTAPFAIPFLTDRPAKAIDVVFCVFILYCGLFTMIVKTSLGQPLQSNLSEPDLSVSLLLLGTYAAAAGYFAGKQLRIRSPFIGVVLSLRNVEIAKMMAVVTFFLGAALNIVHNAIYVRSDKIGEGQGFGGLGVFLFLLNLGLVLQIWLVAATNSKSGRHVLKGMIGTIVLMTIVANARKVGIDSFIIAAVALAFFRSLRINPGILGAGIAILLMFVGYLVPAIQIVRGDVIGMSAQEKLAITYKVISDSGYNPAALYSQLNAASAYSVGTEDSNYIYPSTLPIARFALIIPIDQVARSMASSKQMGLDPILNDLYQMIPSAFVEKTGATAPDLIGWHFGFRSPGVIGRPVVGLIASSLASFGIFGVALLPFIAFFAAAVILDLVSGSLVDNPFGVFIVCHSMVLTEKEFSQLLVYFMYGLPIVLITITILTSAVRAIVGLSGRENEYTRKAPSKAEELRAPS